MKAKHLRVIQEIQDSIPKELLMNITKMEPQFSTLKTIVQAALEKPDSEVSPRQKHRMQSLLDSGYLDREVEVINTPVEKQISDLLDAKIAEAVKDGRLPAKAPTLKLLNNKGKQYARRQHARLKALFEGENPDVVPGPQDDQKDEAQHPPRTDDGGLLQTPGAAATE